MIRTNTQTFHWCISRSYSNYTSYGRDAWISDRWRKFVRTKTPHVWAAASRILMCLKTVRQLLKNSYFCLYSTSLNLTHSYISTLFSRYHVVRHTYATLNSRTTNCNIRLFSKGQYRQCNTGRKIFSSIRLTGPVPETFTKPEIYVSWNWPHHHTSSAMYAFLQFQCT